MLIIGDTEKTPTAIMLTSEPSDYIINIAYKNELLFSRGINFDKLPSWQKRGIGVYWANIEKAGYNPVTKQSITAIRRGLKVEYELPLGEQYANMVTSFLD